MSLAMLILAVFASFLAFLLGYSYGVNDKKPAKREDETSNRSAIYNHPKLNV